MGIGAGALAVMYGIRCFFARGSSAKELIQTASETNKVNQRWAYLEPGLAVALEQDQTLEDIVDRLTPFFRFDEEVGQAFVETAAGAAEFQLRLDEIKHKRSIAKTFGSFTTTLVSRTRELRRAVREQAPAMLEEFDEIAADVQKYQKDSHDTYWKEGF